jgi:hypothetical protein
MTSTTEKNGRLGNQIIRNLAVSLIAEKHNLKVVFDSNVNEDINKGLIIDFDIFQNLYGMLKSTDTGNWEVAKEIIANCEFEASKPYIIDTNQSLRWREQTNDCRYGTNSQREEIKLKKGRPDYNIKNEMRAEEEDALLQRQQDEADSERKRQENEDLLKAYSLGGRKYKRSARRYKRGTRKHRSNKFM